MLSSPDAGGCCDAADGPGAVRRAGSTDTMVYPHPERCCISRWWLALWSCVMGTFSSIRGSTTSPAPRLITPSHGAGSLSADTAAAPPQPASAACFTMMCASVSTLLAWACVAEWPDTEGRESEHTM